MKEKTKDSKEAKISGKRRNHRLIALFLLLVVAGGAVYYFLFGKNKLSGGVAAEDMSTYSVKRGDLVISVTESGEIKAVNSTDIKCEVEGRTTIISIVDEGAYITPQDVADGKVLCELDKSEIEQRYNQQVINYSNAQADLAEAQESLAIQINQNESDIQASEMDAEFALMDFKKYLGGELAARIIVDVNDVNNPDQLITTDLLETPVTLAQAGTDGVSAIAGGSDSVVSEINDPIVPKAYPPIGGQALQTLKELTNNISLSQSQLERASDKLDWTRKLREKEYVAETELRADEYEVQSLNAQLEKSQISLELFKLYEFPKEGRKLLAGYFEAMRELERTKARARSRLAQEQAKLRNREATHDLQKANLEKLKKQLAACTIKATVPGQVVYGSSLLDRWERRNNPIKDGADVRERQVIISIPDTSQMMVDLKINENWVSQVEPGMPTRITISALPGKTFTGKVIKRAPIADPENWFSPDLKVYSTEVSINEDDPDLKTGMTADTEIIINQLKDVIYIPIQAVITIEDKKICYVSTDKGPQIREVEVGAFNNDFVEIKSGLNAGDKVLLNPPRVENLPAGLSESKAERADRKAGAESEGPQSETEQQGEQSRETPGAVAFELTDERIEQIMQGMKQFDPAKYEKFDKLRQEDPEKFKEELRKEMERFMKQMREQGGPPDMQNRQGQGSGFGGGSGSSRGGFRRSRGGAQQGD
jgi:RND family efflux transporter MFP subunit